MIALGFGVVAVAVSAEPVGGSYYEWDAAQSPGPATNWPSVTANAYDWGFDAGSQTAVDVTDERFRATKAYLFPGARDESCAHWDARGSDQPATFEFLLDVDADNGVIFEAGGSVDGIRFDLTNGLLRGTVSEGTNVYITHALTPDDTNRFIHVVYVADSTNDIFSLYVDGTLTASNTWADGDDWSGSNEAGLGGTAGGTPDNGDTGDFTGKLALFRYYRNKAFTPAEVTQNFESLVPVPGEIIWSALAISTVSIDSAWAQATVNTNLDEAVLVWDTADRGTGGPGAWMGATNLGPQAAGTVSGQMTGLLGDTEYTWRLYGTNSWPTSAWSRAGTFITPLSAAQTPAFTSVVATTWPAIELGWQDNAEHETGYLLKRSIGGGAFTLLAALGADTTSYVDLNATESGVTYTYRLAATNSADGSATLFAACERNVAAPVRPSEILLFESFEDPVVAGAATGTDPTDWVDISPRGNRAGLGHLSGTTYTGIHGVQAAWLNVYNADPVLQSTLNILDTNLVADSLYVLTFNGAQEGSDYTVLADLLAGTNVVLTAQVRPGSRDFDENVASNRFLAKSGDIGIGEALAVRLRVTYSGYPWNQQSYVDNLRLDALPSSLDEDPPTPNPLTWVEPPTPAGENGIHMVCSPASDMNFVQYFFTNTVNGNSSGWLNVPVWWERELGNGVTYTYKAKARDTSANFNETAWSAEASATVDSSILFYDGFEYPVVAGQTSATDPMDWQDLSTRPGKTGLGHLEGTLYTNMGDHQAAWLNEYNNAPLLLTTTNNLDAALVPGKIPYTLTFKAASNGRMTYTLCADLLAGTNVVMTAQVTPSNSRDFDDAVASNSCWVATDDPRIGEALAIRLYIAKGVWNQEGYVDNLTLLGPPPPPPAGMMFLVR